MDLIPFPLLLKDHISNSPLCCIFSFSLIHDHSYQHTIKISPNIKQTKATSISALLYSKKSWKTCIFAICNSSSAFLKPLQSGWSPPLHWHCSFQGHCLLISQSNDQLPIILYDLQAAFIHLITSSSFGPRIPHSPGLSSCSDSAENHNHCSLS